MIIHLIRHGKTPANEQKLYCGQSDPALSQTGEGEAARAAQTVRYPQGELYITSGLRRTDQTLALLYGKQADYKLPDLREINFGAFEMRGHAELSGTPDYQAWLDNWHTASPPNGESRPEFSARILRGFEQAVHLCTQQNVQSAVIVTHSGVIAGLMEQLFPAVKSFHAWQPTFLRGYSLALAHGLPIEYTPI